MLKSKNPIKYLIAVFSIALLAMIILPGKSVNKNPQVLGWNNILGITVFPSKTLLTTIKTGMVYPTYTPSPTPTPKPGQVAYDCPKSTQPCIPCQAGEQYCRVETGETSGFLGWACQNNNPGNIRYSDYRNQIIVANGGVAACGQRESYMVFKNFNKGRNALKAYVTGISLGQHSAYPECGNCNLKYFFSKYAPAGDQNDPNSYANNVANWIGVDANTTTLTWIVNNKLDLFVDAIKQQEGWFVL